MENVDSKNEVVISIRVPAPLKLQLDRMSEHYDWSVSHCVRSILQQHFYPTEDFVLKLLHYSLLNQYLKNKNVDEDCVDEK